MENGKFEITVGELKQIIKEEATKLKTKMLAEAETKKKLAILESKKVELMKQLNEMQDMEECGEMEEGIGDWLSKAGQKAKEIVGTESVRKDDILKDLARKIGYLYKDGKWLKMKRPGAWEGKVKFDQQTLNDFVAKAEADDWQGLTGQQNGVLVYRGGDEVNWASQTSHGRKGGTAGE